MPDQWSLFCSKVRGGSPIFAEVVFVVILITIDDPIRENEDLSIPIEAAVTQARGIDRFYGGPEANPNKSDHQPAHGWLP